MLEISLFADESGESGTESKYYLMTLVFHEQNDSIFQSILLYENDIRSKGLSDIPLHTSPLMNGHDEYVGMDIQERKCLLQSFFIMLQHLPVKYHTFSYRKSEFFDNAALGTRIRRDIVNLIFDNLDYLQAFDRVKVYYDDGQYVVPKLCTMQLSMLCQPTRSCIRMEILETIDLHRQQISFAQLSSQR